MALRVYLVPIVGDLPGPDARGEHPGFYPKYVGNGGIAGAWQGIDYGKEPWMLVFADVTAGEHASISGNADVTSVPANLDQQVGAALATVQGKLEAANLPADWVTAAMSYRTVLKWTVRMLLLMQRFRGLGGAAARFFAAGLTLDSTVGDIPATPRQRLTAAAQSFGLDTSSITLATTVRAALRVLGQQMTFAVTIRGEAI